MVSKYKSVNASAIGAGSAETFTQTFDATTDWGAASGGFYTMVILQATHGKSAQPLVQLYETVAATFEQVDAEIILNATGDVTIKVTEVIDARFAGKVVIL